MQTIKRGSAGSAARIAAVVLALTCAREIAAQTGPGGTLLSLEEATETALRENHLLAADARAVDAAEEQTAALRTRRLPLFQLDAWGGRMESLDFTFPAGSFGVIPPFGPVPAAETTFSVPADNRSVAMATVSQPLTQQYKIGLGIRFARLDHQIAQESLRWQRQRVAADVRATYYQIAATEAGIVALRDLVAAVEELDTVTTRYHEEGLVLRSDFLEVRARLTRERQRLAVAESALDTQKEHLNQLLGRDVSTSFQVAKPSDLLSPADGLTLEEARERARVARAEVHTAELRTAQADTARKLALSGWIPDVSLTASYTHLGNFATLPDHSAAVGVFASWEPFDWGRKRHEAAQRAQQTEAGRQGRQETEQRITVEVGQRWRAVKDAAALLEATRQEEEASTASLDTDRNRYRESAAILRDVLRTEARLSGARHEFTDALAGYWSSVAELERAMGDAY